MRTEIKKLICAIMEGVPPHTAFTNELGLYYWTRLLREIVSESASTQLALKKGKLGLWIKGPCCPGTDNIEGLIFLPLSRALDFDLEWLADEPDGEKIDEMERLSKALAKLASEVGEAVAAARKAIPSEDCP